MPEYLTPGVYVEETSFRSRSIEGVATSTTGMAGLTEYGPVPYRLGGLQPEVAMIPSPRLITSFTEFERAFGDIGDVGSVEEDDRTNYLALAARAFFADGGRRLYVSRVFGWARDDDDEIDDEAMAAAFASLARPEGDTPLVRWRARWPGRAGGRIQVTVGFRRSKNVVVTDGPAGAQVGRLAGVGRGAAVELGSVDAAGRPVAIRDRTLPDPGQVRIVDADEQGNLGYRNADGGVDPVGPGTVAYHITLAVTATLGSTRTDVYNELELDPEHRRSIFKALGARDPVDDLALVWLEQVPLADGAPPPAPGDLLGAVLALREPTFLAGGGDGMALTPGELLGKEADPDDVDNPATGLQALGEEEDIAIVATPDTVRLAVPDQRLAVQNLVGHCERLRYRIAIVDPPSATSALSAIRAFRAQFDTRYAALYYPWVEIVDPVRRPEPGAPPLKLPVPPSGYVAGIYARSDGERGVHKAPANEVVLGIDRFCTNVTHDRQSVLNPEGINALRYFEGRSNRVWGARTMSSDPEWKYVNVRRLFIYLEHSIDRSTQWAVFEPNNERLWASIRQTIEAFLLTVWRTGALMGTTPEEAFFVRCDRTTMTQNDLDNGRLICLIGVSPTYPAEFVIFRIGQWTADAQSA